MDGSSSLSRGKRSAHRPEGAQARDRSPRPTRHHEEPYLDIMFDLPSREGVKEIVISQQVVEGTAGPLYMYTGGARAIQ